MPTNNRESGFEIIIANHFVEHNGYELGVSAGKMEEPLDA